MERAFEGISKVQKWWFRAGSVANKELGRVGPKTADPQGNRDPFRDTPHAESLLWDSLKCPKITASGCIFREIAVSMDGDRNLRFA